jgi:hypothetical protein
MKLWTEILAEYTIADRAGQEILCLACEALDRADVLAHAIEIDGPVIRDPKTGVSKSHPSLRDELNNRAFCAKQLERLGLNLEPVKPMGRPPRGY